MALYVRHRRLQHSFTAFANSHYNSRLGSAIFSSGDELGKSRTHSAHTQSLTHKTFYSLPAMVYRLFLLTESIQFIYDTALEFRNLACLSFTLTHITDVLFVLPPKGDDDEDDPMIGGFADDVPMVIA